MPMNRSLDTLALLGLSGLLLVAFCYQIVLSELPCPLCALQRVGFVVAGVGLMLNLRVGYSPAHYGLVLLTALVAGSASLRQIALHIVPGTGHYGSAMFGLHFYTWAFVGYGALVAYVGVMLLLEARPPARDRVPPASRMRAFACWLFVAVTAANVVSFLLECGLGPCPDNPVGYLWLPGAK
jgi:disulfide bond formation protein DsbB